MSIPGSSLKTHVVSRSEMMMNVSNKANKNKNASYDNVNAVKSCGKKEYGSVDPIGYIKRSVYVFFKLKSCE